MMSHYGVPCDCTYDPTDETEWLEVSIEPLTGAAFKLTVGADETIISIKFEIQTLEGIPVSQQHLLYNFEELDNSASVRDYSIQDGARLQLVLSMRVGPISTNRPPQVDERTSWRELQELMSDTHRDDLFHRLPSGSKVTVLMYPDGEQVNLLRVVENKDGSFSPLPKLWSGTSVRNLFADENPEESAKRLQENLVTMGKVQELKERLETLSIQRKEKRFDDGTEGNSPVKSQVNPGVEEDDEETKKDCDVVGDPSGDLASHSNQLKIVRRPEKNPEDGEECRPRRRLLSCSKVSVSGLSKARKEAKNIIRMQSKLSMSVEADGNRSFGFKRPPLPEIRRSPPSENKTTQDEKLDKSMREKTARSFAIVEEESDLAPAASICSSQSSVVAVPGSEEVAAAIAFSPMSRERVFARVRRSRYKISRYVLENDERPKTTPGKVDCRRDGKHDQYCSLVGGESESSERTNHILSTISNILPRSRVDGEEDQTAETGNGRHPTVIRNPSIRDELSKPQKLTPPLVKKRLRCSHCKKKLNITNTYNCRCGELFCAVHRYSEVHNCLFDYKQEGRKLLQQMNSLIAVSKLPKI